MAPKDGSPDALAEYRRRRDFAKTPEPGPDSAPGGGSGSGATGSAPAFVVQIHDASRMHFDFRLEVGGALASWAVPKGPSPDPRKKRLAVPTEDHPLDYRHFEGVIARGEYGGGTVIVWDEGGYRNLSTDRSGAEIPFADALHTGHASFRLDGAKLHGAYALTRIRDSRGQGEAWLLVKEADRWAAPGRGTPDPHRARSVLSGRTLRQVAAETAGAAGGAAGGAGAGRAAR
ncbi:DNA polymerase ligase N-terminal domain-containing protein [Actinacidiphila sp. ITFR-21]|uniref:DNA polymerase ligase N-terminal domain-containing protein n=1 Tax=Actinacidiphila sp. ITFR-21 TaxID=3075199 RepID=UPI00288B024E|nr:DNA polymerase ligase N-terminal domain-containing protein [Streptomyces sp. ITFR-21]WNI16098.1 DNA polymerase ligase N-terminal domain-containing protein [Streptomyces sp. ITFR-21]